MSESRTIPVAPTLPDGFFAKLAYYFGSLPITRYLLVFVPICAALEYTHAAPTWIFLTSCLAVLALVTAIGKATEEIAMYTSATIGGLLNATFGNVTELIIATIALRQGLHEIVKASIVGSIIGNLLLLLGASMLAGGLKYKEQKFSQVGSSINVSMMALCLIAMVIPSILSYGAVFDPALQAPGLAPRLLHHSSVGISIVMLVVYGLSLLFSLRTHRHVFSTDAHEHEQPQWPRGFATIALLVITVVVAWMSDVFVASLDGLMQAHPIFTPTFMGVVVVAIVGNAAEGSVAIWVARQNKMELSFQIAMGSSIQIALFVAPVLVLLSQFIGPHPMNLDFNVFETASIWASVLIASIAFQDGHSHWFEGVMFLAVYVIFCVVFFFHP